MQSFTIWHNPRCSKSRETLALLEQHSINPNIILYLETPPSLEELKSVIKKLHCPIEHILRKKERCYAEFISNQSLSEDELLELMHKNPTLIERPIVISSDKAIIGRPPENVLELLK